MTEEAKQHLADQLADLASDAGTEPWPARLYMLAALWLETEREHNSDDRTVLTVAWERVKAKAIGEPPEGFRGCVASWLGELVDGVRR